MKSRIQEVVFRVDESALVGFGHISRCYALALAFLDVGCKVVFYCRDLRHSTRKTLEAAGILVTNLASEGDFLQMDLSTSVVVVDGYQFGPDFWHLLSGRTGKTVCIDDFRGIPYQADIVVCYNEGLQVSQFELTPKSKLFLGGRYLLIRPEIRYAALRAKSRRPPKAVMLATGGTQQSKWISMMLSHLAVIEPSAQLWVLTGQRLAPIKVLQGTGLTPERVCFFSGLTAPQMVNLYRNARYLVVPASTLMLEAFAAGCPVISGWMAANQKNSLGFYSRNGMIENLGDLRVAGVSKLRKARGRVLRCSDQMIRRQRRYIAQSCIGVGEIVQEIINGD